MVSAPPSLATRRSPGRSEALVRSMPDRRRMLSVPGCGLPGERRSATYADHSDVKPAGTKPRLSEPMSPPCGNGAVVTSRASPPGPNAQIFPDPSSGAIRSSPNVPNEDGANAIPPSTDGACRAIVVTRPAQSTANRVVAPLAAAVTSSRWTQCPTSSNAIPLGVTPGRSASRCFRPSGSTLITPVAQVGSSAKTLSRANQQPADVALLLLPSARYGSGAGLVAYPSASRA